MSDAKLVNIARLMTTYNFEIEQLPDNLKCAQCKLVLKEACYLPCCCRYCRVCIVNMIERGDEFCPGGSDECGESLLSCYQSDYLANKGVSRLTVKCPHDGCVHKCHLAIVEEHLRECPRKGEECPFRELGCTEDKLAAEDMGEHLQHDNRKHSEILIRMIANINMEIENLKQRDEVSRKEIETLKEINEVSSREIKILKDGLVLKDEQIRSIMNEMIHVQKAIKSIEQVDREIAAVTLLIGSNNDKLVSEMQSVRDDIATITQDVKSIMDEMIHVQTDIKSIKVEKEDLAGQVTILTEEIERETVERRENDELDSARVIEHVDRKLPAVTLLNGSNNDKLVSEMQSVRSDIESINQDVKSIKDDICSVKSQVQSVQALVGLGQIDTSFVQLIDIDIDKTNWWWGERLSEYFTGAVHPYKYRLASWNWDIATTHAYLWIQLRIYAGPNDGQLAWPFEARVVITVTDRDQREVCKSISLQCQIERPPDKNYKWSDDFKFLHSELRGAGLNLSLGVRVSCVIVPGSG